MGEFFFRLYLLYTTKIPLARGKYTFARILKFFFGSIFVTTKYNFKIKVFPTSTQDMSFFSEKSNDVIVNEVLKLKKGDVFIDIGANIGFVSILASKQVGENGKVFSFEPSFREYGRLIDALMINSIGNVRAYNCAIGDFQGEINLSVSKIHTGINRIGKHKLDNTKDSVPQVVIPIFQLDMLLDYLNNSKIDLMKIDIEGAEFHALKGATQLLKNGVIKKIVIEITPKFLREFGVIKEDIYNFLKLYKYYPLVNSDEWQYDEIFELRY
ncbi:MAG: FkbM family methyltransferase [Chitinophagaceae bacterium]